MENKTLGIGIIIGMFLFIGAFLLLNNQKEEIEDLTSKDIKGIKSYIGESGTNIYGEDWEVNYLENNKSINISGVSNVLDNGEYKPFSEVYKIGRDGRFIKIIGSDFNVTLDWGIVQTNGVRRDSQWILTNYPTVQNKLNQKVLRNLVTWNMNVNVSTLPQVVKDNVAGFYFELEGTQGDITYNDVQRIERQGDGYTYYVLVIKDAVLNFENPAKNGIDVTINKTTITYNDVRSAVTSGNIEIGNTFEHLNKDTLEEIRVTFVGYEEEMDVEIKEDTLDLYKWNRELGLNINLGNNSEGLSWEKGVFRNKYNNYEIVQYPKGDNNFEFEVILDSPPPRNWIEFNINTTGLNFEYQGRLDIERNNFTHCNATSCWDNFNNNIAERPENIVDSYAVYSEELRNNEYKTGKLFHIYRVWVNDSSGNLTWGGIFINKTNGKMKLNVSQTYLNNAIYPVTIDPDIGYTTAGGSSASAVDALGFRTSTDQYTASAGDTVTALSLHYYVNGVSSWEGAVYDTSSNIPNNRLATAESDATQIASPGEWVSITGLSQSLVDGSNYAMAFSDLTGTIRYQWDYVPNSMSADTSSSLPASWTENSASLTRVSMYFTYEEGSAGEDCGCIDYENWEENLSDNCVMDIDCSPYNITYINTGTFTCNALLNATKFPELLTNQHERAGSSCVEVLN